MRIVYLHQYFNPLTSAAGSRSYEFARRFVSAGHEVHVVTSDSTSASGTRWREEVIDGINVHWVGVPYANAMGKAKRIRAFLRFAALSATRARGLRGDVVFATSTPLTIALPGRFATLFRSTPMVFEVRDLWPEMPIAVGALKGVLAKWAARSLERFAYQNSTEIVALSDGMKAGVLATGYPASLVTVATNASDVEMFDVDDSRAAAWRATVPGLGTRQIVLYCGTLGLVNRVGYLVDLAVQLRNVNPSVAFVVVGQGAEFELIRQRAVASEVLNENFFLLGSVPKRDVPAIFRAATIVTSLFAPIREMEANSANKFFDGLAAGKPIAINYGGWQEEVLAESGAGIRLHPSDQAANGQTLSALLKDDVRLREMGLAARGLALDRYSRDAVTSKVLAVLERVADAGRSNAGQSS
ncbi:glycosyltransferase family 4 protein [Agromyces sp. NPDC058484]|uniref:glycosyltransferase family 4 protein n=1 Tax=Agromyces sp. NPDC058484 TaxID=3346524 RepID=UPI00365BD7C6